jgi:hypothetical protein
MGRGLIISHMVQRSSRTFAFSIVKGKMKFDTLFTNQGGERRNFDGCRETCCIVQFHNCTIVENQIKNQSTNTITNTTTTTTTTCGSNSTSTNTATPRGSEDVFKSVPLEGFAEVKIGFEAGAMQCIR